MLFSGEVNMEMFSAEGFRLKHAVDLVAVQRSITSGSCFWAL